MPTLRYRILALSIVAAGILVVVEAFSGRQSLVVYCAHDAEYAEPILRGFERRTGIKLDIRFDTEATKSLGLVELIQREAQHPRADVFWNNQLMGMLDLQRAGCLSPYRGPGYKRIPVGFKDPDGMWAGFAARFRVYIVNTNQMAETSPDELRQMTDVHPERVALAKPLYGTTRSHFTALWHWWGGERLKAWHLDVTRRGLVEATGNAMVKNLVAAGTCQMGWTDSDDFFAAQAAGSPVAMYPWRSEKQETICIPNTIAILQGARHVQQAQQLVDYLLSAENEVELAKSPSRQVPLGPVPIDALPPDVQRMLPWVQDAVNLMEVSGSREECLLWLKSMYVP